MKKNKMPLPRFLNEGYADYGDRTMINPFTDEVVPYYGGFDFVGVKPDAPQWAKDEYAEWVRTQKKAKSTEYHTKL